MDTKHIEIRYNDLAEKNCCLSCGGAINYSEVKPGEICVDLGCGKGADTLRMAEAASDLGFAYGIDISENMITRAAQNAEKLGVKNVKFLRCSLEKLPFPDNSVNVVISNCTLNHVGDKQAVWNEIYRILKNNGRFVVSDIYATQPIADVYKNDPQAVAECWAGAITKEEYSDVLVNAGFRNVEILEESDPYPKGSAEVCSFTIASTKSKTSSCGCGCGCN